MPPSQLKRLKASLREQGITGLQKSKKQKKSHNKSEADHAKRSAALASIRETFNPFEFKHLSRPQKHSYVTSTPGNGTKAVLGRPGVTKSHGEELRRKSLLPEMNRKNKVGGILDRRIGEADPTMSLEDKMMARFEREQQRKRGANVFDLEEEDDEEVGLTHGGRALFDEDDLGKEDYDAASVGGSSEGNGDGFLKKKRRRRDGDSGEDEDLDVDADGEGQPERKKSKAEVMKEVIAKSKQHKYERQQQKEDDDDLREELDNDLQDVLAALRGHVNGKVDISAPPKESTLEDFGINPDRAALLAGKSRDEMDKEYDVRVRQMLHDQRSKPTERTKTEEEKIKEDAEKLKALEERRTRRMKGELISDDEPESEAAQGEEQDAESIHDDAAEFGLAPRVKQKTRPNGVEDEDDFLIDDDLIASDSEADFYDDEESEATSDKDDTMAADDDEDFLRSVLPKKTQQEKTDNNAISLGLEATTSKLAYTYACPRSHEELLKVFKDVAIADVPTVVQRIRALYHAGLRAENKDKTSDFACALIDHIPYLSDQTPAAPFSVVESLIRHIHSMSRSCPTEIAIRFREHLKRLQASNNPTPGDLTILTAIGSIYPTSDHFHQVVTPAITLMARWLGLTFPSSPKDIATGAFLAALCLHYQRLAKRYVPELLRYTSLCLTSPHATPALLAPHTTNILTAATLWSASPAFPEIFSPLLSPLEPVSPQATHRLRILLHAARQHRRPLALHDHRPLPIKTAFPKFEDAFDPTKHYDPSKERSDAAKLRKEYKRERKGALRELRKDGNFVARERLREKRERDRRYEEGQRRLVAEIQGEEGRERNEYERERRRRKGKR